MPDKKKLERIFTRHGCADFRWADPREFVVAHWVRMKCLFGCGEYGRTATCPPSTPSVEECRRFFAEYRTAAVFHFEKAMRRPEDRHAWTRKITLRLLKVEREVFLSGLEKAFLLPMDSCAACAVCAGKPEACKKPRQARPTPEAMAVDVFSTVRRLGYPIEVLSDFRQVMNRYAFLLVD